MSARKRCWIGHVETISGGFFVLFLVKRLSLLFCLVFGGFFFLPWQSPWFESAVKPSATELTSVSGCLCHPYLPRAGGWVRYDFWELTCCQLFPFEEAGDGGIAPCTASPGGEVAKVSALPGSVLQAGLTRAFTAARCPFGVVALELGCSSCGKGRQGDQSCEAEPRQAAESWLVSSCLCQVGREQLLLVLTSPSSSNLVASHGFGTERASSVAAVSSLPAVFAFLPVTLAPVFAWPPSERRPTTSHTPRAVALPSPTGDTGLHGHEAQQQAQSFGA